MSKEVIFPVLENLETKLSTDPLLNFAISSSDGDTNSFESATSAAMVNETSTEDDLVQTCNLLLQKYRSEQNPPTPEELRRSVKQVQTQTDVCKQINDYVRRDIILLRAELDISSNTGVQKSLLKVLRQFERIYFRAVIETVTGNIMELGEEDKFLYRLDNFIINYVFREPELLKSRKFSYNGSWCLTEKGQIENGKRFLIKLCQILYLMEQCLICSLVPGLNRMFVKSSTFNSLNDIFTYLSREIISGKTLLPKELQRIGFTSAYQQSFMEKRKFVINSLVPDLCDGIILSRLVENLITEKCGIFEPLYPSVRNPNGDRLRKVSNLNECIRMAHMFNLLPQSCVEGNSERPFTVNADALSLGNVKEMSRFIRALLGQPLLKQHGKNFIKKLARSAETSRLTFKRSFQEVHNVAPSTVPRTESTCIVANDQTPKRKIFAQFIQCTPCNSSPPSVVNPSTRTIFNPSTTFADGKTNLCFGKKELFAESNVQTEHSTSVQGANYMSENTSFKSQLEAAQERYTVLDKRLVNASKELETQQERYELLSSRCEASEEVVQELKTSNRALMEEVTSLKQQLTVLQSHYTQINVLFEEAVQQEKNKENTVFEVNHRCDQAENKVQMLEKYNNELLEKTNDLKTQLKAANERQAVLDKKFIDAKVEVEQHQARYEQLNGRCVASEEAVQHLTTSNTTFSEEVTSLKHLLTDLQNRYTQINIQYEKAVQQEKEKDNLVVEINQRCNQAENKVQRLEKDNNELLEKTNEFRTLLEAAHERHTVLNQQFIDAKVELEKHQERYEQLNKRCEASEKTVQKLTINNMAFIEDIASLKHELITSQNFYTELKLQFEEAVQQEKNKENLVVEVNQRCDQAENKVQRLEKYNRELLEKTNDFKTQLESAHERYTVLDKQFIDAKVEIEKHQERYEQLNSRCEVSEETVKKLTIKDTSSNEEVTFLKHQLTVLQNRYTQIDMQFKKALYQEKEKDNLVVEVNQRCETAENKVQMLNIYNEELVEENTSLKTQLEASHVRYTVLDRQFIDANIELKKQQESYEQLNSRYGASEKLLQQLQTSNTSLNNEVASLQNQLVTSQNKWRVLEQKLTERDNLCQHLMSKNRELAYELNKWDMKYDEVIKKKNILEKTLNDLKDELKMHRQSYEEITKEVKQRQTLEDDTKQQVVEQLKRVCGTLMQVSATPYSSIKRLPLAGFENTPMRGELNDSDS